MTTLVSRLDGIQMRLDALARQHRVPGASLGVMDGDELLEFASGVTNLKTGVEVTPDTLFQIGSNTKLYTTTLVMQLVDDGEVSLDEPVRTYLPELDLSDDRAGKITVRMLVTHTSGIEGDHFEDFGRGDDSLERYVASFKDLGLVHDPGAMWSYSNSAFCLAGRLVERLRDQLYHEALRERIWDPLGLTATTVLPEEMLAYRYAAGHFVQGSEPPTVAPRIVMSPSQAAAGSMTCSTPREVLGFVRMHLDDGCAPNGDRVLSSTSVAEMQRTQAKLPESSLGAEMGLGWILNRWDGERVIGHGGGTIGQLSFLQVLPDRRFAVCLLTNSTNGGLLWRALGRWLFSELAGVEMPQVPKPPDEPPVVELSRYEGLYRRVGLDTTISVSDDHLEAKLEGTGPLASLQPTRHIALRPIDAETFHASMPQGDAVCVFLERDRRGRPRWIHFGGRVARRIEEPTKAKPAKQKGAKKKAAKKKAPKTKTGPARKAKAKRKPAKAKRAAPRSRSARTRSRRR